MTEVSASVACSHSTRLECTYNSPLTPPHLHHHNPLTCLLLPIFLDPLQLFCSCFRWENSSTCVHFKYWGWGVWERKNCDIIVHLLQILSNKHFVSRIYTFPFFVNAWTESLFFFSLFSGKQCLYSVFLNLHFCSPNSMCTPQSTQEFDFFI